MPCYHDDSSERAYDALVRNATTALLCGVLGGNETALFYGHAWHAAHLLIDERRKAVKYDWQDARILELKNEADRILVEYFNKQPK